MSYPSHLTPGVRAEGVGVPYYYWEENGWLLERAGWEWRYVGWEGGGEGRQLPAYCCLSSAEPHASHTLYPLLLGWLLGRKGG